MLTLAPSPYANVPQPSPSLINRNFVLMGNSGVGKSWLLNQMLDEERFLSGVDVEGVTTSIECASVLGPANEPITLLNIPGLVEANPEYVKRNQRILQQALAKGGLYKLIFVFAAGVGGRVLSKDVFAYREVCKGYGLPNLPIIMNNLQLNLKKGQSKDEELRKYWARLKKSLQGFDIHVDCQVIEQHAGREDILYKLHAAAESFPWQEMPPARPMNFNEADQATQAVMQQYEKRLEGLTKQLNENQAEMRRLMEEARVREEQQRQAYEEQMAALQQNLTQMHQQLSNAEAQQRAALQQMQSLNGQLNQTAEELERQAKAREAYEEQSRQLQGQIASLSSQIANQKPRIEHHTVEVTRWCIIC